MLAGISHDLRTPLARLRLETEMSVADEDARDTWRPTLPSSMRSSTSSSTTHGPIMSTSSRCLLRDVIDACTYAVQDHEDIKITVDVPADLRVMADEVELQRVI